MTRTIGIVLYEDAEELDFVGPYEVFGGLVMQDRDWQVVTVSEDGNPVRAANGLKVAADHSFSDAPPLDVILVPGGIGSRQEMQNPAMLEYLRKNGERAEWVTSVCTGALLLHSAGFLGGKKATTHWSAIEMLRGLGDVEVLEDERYVQDGNLVTSAGISAGIDMSLYLVSLLKDDAAAKNVQKMMEYYPKPPVFEGTTA